MYQLKDVAAVLKTGTQIGLKPGRGWKKAYITGNLFNSVKVKIKSSSQAISATLTISYLFYGKYIIDGGNSRARYKAGPRPFPQAAINSPEFKQSVQLYLKDSIDLKIQKAFKKAQREFNKAK